MGKFVLSNRVNGQYYFVLKAGNGEIILSSEGYTTKSGCLNGIESVKINSSNDSRFVRLSKDPGRLYFLIKAGNGEIIGTSEMYFTEAGRERGIEAVKRHAPTANIEDQS